MERKDGEGDQEDTRTPTSQAASRPIRSKRKVLFCSPQRVERSRRLNPSRDDWHIRRANPVAIVLPMKTSKDATRKRSAPGGLDRGAMGVRFPGLAFYLITVAVVVFSLALGERARSTAAGTKGEQSWQSLPCQLRPFLVAGGRLRYQVTGARHRTAPRQRRSEGKGRHVP